MKTKLKTPNIGYNVVIRLEKPISEIGRASISTKKIECLYFNLKLLLIVLLIE